jgi:hypothetical protein
MAAIKEKASKTVGGAAARRAQGDRPGAMRAFAGATVAGAPNLRRRLPAVAELRTVPRRDGSSNRVHATEGANPWRRR